MRYEYWKATNGKWFWHLKEGFWKVLAQSGDYADKPEVQRAIDLDRSSRPDGPGIRKFRRYRLSFAALMALAVAVGLAWLAGYSVLERWDTSMVVTDATVVARGADGSGRNRTSWLRLNFKTPDERMISTVIFNQSVESGTTTIRIRYNPHDPKEVLMDSDAGSYFFALVMLFAAAGFVFAAYASSLHNGERHFM